MQRLPLFLYSREGVEKKLEWEIERRTTAYVYLSLEEEREGNLSLGSIFLCRHPALASASLPLWQQMTQ